MDRRTFLTGVGLSGVGAVAGCVDTASDQPEEDGESQDGVAVETVAEGIEHPWGIAFHPENPRLFVTERDSGRLLSIGREDGTTRTIEGTPSVASGGQGGLLDVALHPGFPGEPWVYLSYAATNDEAASSTHLGRGLFDPETESLSTFEVLRAAEPFVESDAHYGSRVVFGPDGAVYLTVGDRQFKDFGPEHVSQDATNELGTTLRLRPDGSIPEDNPFIGEAGVVDSIFSYGHRNVQGMAIHPETGELWQSEHGEQDGDEINVVEAGGNHGWPVATHACPYGGDERLGDVPAERDDLVPPVHYWECGSGGFPPSGAAFYTGDAFEAWRGDLFVGNLAGRYLGRFAVEGRDVEELDPLLEGSDWRIRAVAEAPDTGHLYVAIDSNEGRIVRLVPE